MPQATGFTRCWHHMALASHAAGFTCPWLHIQCVAQVDIMESEPNQTVRVKGALCAVCCALCAVYATLCMPRWRSGAGVARSACACARPISCACACARRLCLCRVACAGLHPGVELAAALCWPARHHPQSTSMTRIRCFIIMRFPRPLPQTSSPTPRARLCSPCRRVPRHSCWRCSWLAWTHERAWRPLGWQVSCRVAHERIRLASTPPMH